LRYSPKTSSVVTIAEAHPSAVTVKARWGALSEASARATQLERVGKNSGHASRLGQP
jgi:hypothetical protein